METVGLSHLIPNPNSLKDFFLKINATQISNSSTNFYSVSFLFKKKSCVCVCVVVCVLYTSSECGVLSFHHVVLTEETWVSGLVAGAVTHSQLAYPFSLLSFSVSR